jgi:DNA-binding transcriptional LysR family regulator
VNIGGSIVISSALSVRQAAVDGLGPALLPDWLIAAELASGTLVDLFPTHEVTATGFDTAAWLLYPSKTYLPLKTRAFIDFAKTHIGEHIATPSIGATSSGPSRAASSRVEIESASRMR